MKTLTKLAAALLSVILLSLPANADADVSLSFHEALAKSNSDYNEMKKKNIEDEQERSNDWGERQHTAISIVQHNLDADYQDFSMAETGIVDSRRQVSAVEVKDKDKDQLED